MNEKLGSRSGDIPCYSAGHTKHEWTSWACIDALFPFIEEKYEDFLKSMENGNDEEDGSKHAAPLHEDDIEQEAKKGKFEETEQDKHDEVVEDKDDATKDTDNTPGDKDDAAEEKDVAAQEEDVAAEDKNVAAKGEEDNPKKHEDL